MVAVRRRRADDDVGGPRELAHAASPRRRTACSALCRARRSASITSPASATGVCSQASTVSATTSAIAPHPTRPSRKAATATSLPAFSQAGARSPARPACSARSRQAKTSRSGGSKSRRDRRGPVDGAEGVMEAVGVGEGVTDGQSHVGGRELGDSGPVGELHHRVYDRLGMNNHRHPVVVDAEQLMGLDDLEALVHQGGGVHGDLGAHAPGGMGQGLLHRDPLELGSRPAPERSAAGGEHQPGHLVRVRRPARRHWCRAQCSESTGTISAPGVRRARWTTGAPAMSDSLLARARRRPASRAARVTGRPAKPTTALTTTSPRGAMAASPSTPVTTSVPVGYRRPARRPGRRRRWPRPRAGTAWAWAARRSTERHAPRATTRNRSGSER
jgi:hypothetical protein